MDIVFICGPYRAKTIFGRMRNIAEARRVAIKYWKVGYAVLCPHLNSLSFDKYCPDENFLDGYLSMLRHVSVIVMLPKWKKSEGSRKEHELAVELKKKIIYL